MPDALEPESRALDFNPTYRNPNSLLRLLHRVAFVSTLLILSLSAVGIYWLYQDFIVSSAEAKAVSLSESLVALEYDRLLQPGTQGADQWMAGKPALLKLDQMLKKFLEPYDILKIKIFSTDKEVVYSTDHSIIGQKNPTNLRLDIALAGFNDSKLQTREELYDLSNEIRFDVDVVETYVPIRNSLGQVVGSFELYLDTSKDNQKIAIQVIFSLVFLATVIASIYTIAYLFLRTAVTQLATAQEQLQRLATVDGLTGLLNHREINRLGENEFSRFKRQNKCAAFSLIMADLDDFKLINDRYGHLDGDEVLRVVSGRINQQMRRYSVVGRYGGEEFMVLLPETDSQEVMAVAERIRQAVASQPVILASVQTHVTISSGIATVCDSDTTFNEVLLRADKGLYQAKLEGKNGVGVIDVG